MGHRPQPARKTLNKESVASLKDRLEEAIAPFTRKGIPFKDIVKQSLLTPSCGLASLYRRRRRTGAEAADGAFRRDEKKVSLVMKDFKDKVASCTGARSRYRLGIGGAVRLEGMKVVIADIEEPALKQAEKTLKAGGADVLAMRTDVSKLSDVEALAQKTLDAYGGVHLLFNNAGVNTDISMRKPVWENTIARLGMDDWRQSLGSHLRRQGLSADNVETKHRMPHRQYLVHGRPAGRTATDYLRRD